MVDCRLKRNKDKAVCKRKSKKSTKKVKPTERKRMISKKALEKYFG